MNCIDTIDPKEGHIRAQISAGNMDHQPSGDTAKHLCAVIDKLRSHLAALQVRVEAGERRFPGFSLHENPPRVQRLGFAWLDQKGQHRYFEMAITDNYPLMVANQLKQLAEGIEEAHRDPKSPLARKDRDGVAACP